MAKLNLKSMKKSTKDHIITFAMVIVVYIIVQTMITTGNMSSLMQGLLVPMCTYSIVAIGLNLCVGSLGELSIVMPDLCVWEHFPVHSAPNCYRTAFIMKWFCF